MIFNNGSGYAETGGLDGPALEIRGGLAQEFVNDAIELREFLAGKTLFKDRREFAVLFGKQREIAFRTANVTSQNQPAPPRFCHPCRIVLRRYIRCGGTHWSDLAAPAFWFRCEFLRWGIPVASVSFDQGVGFLRPPTARGVLRELGAFSSGPDVEDRIDQRPSRFDVVAAIE